MFLKFNENLFNPFNEKGSLVNLPKKINELLSVNKMGGKTSEAFLILLGIVFYFFYFLFWMIHFVINLFLNHFIPAFMLLYRKEDPLNLGGLSFYKSSFLAKGFFTRLFDCNGKPGVYIIYCIKNGKVYIGQSKDIGRRLYQHFQLLKNGNHPCVNLQEDYYEYGKNSIFEFPYIYDLEGNNLENKLIRGYFENFLINAWEGDVYNKNRVRLSSELEED